MQEFNNQLVEETESLTIIDYIKLASKKVYKFIEIDFVHDFMNLVDKEGFVIPHDMLLKYVLSDTTNAARVMRLVHQYEFEAETDYTIKKEEATEYQDVLGSSSL